MLLHVEQLEHRGAESFLNWVYTILDRKLIDARRAAHRERRDVDREVGGLALADADSCWNLLDHVYVDSQTPSRVVRRQEAMSAVLASLSDLTDAHREVLQLRSLDGVSAVEAAARLGKTEAAVIALTQRALKALRKSMDRLGEFTRGG
jgi:RNA polymerase sigma factor (sigma-70 family)